MLLEKLANLTPEERMSIAKVFNSDVEFTHWSLDNGWDGWDLVSGTYDGGFEEHVVQIDYQEKSMPLKARFRYYYRLDEFHTNEDELKTILNILNIN